MTVVNASDQLMAEGYLASRQGSGTYVSWELPEELQLVQFRPSTKPPTDSVRTASAKPYLSQRGNFYRQQASWLSMSPDQLKPFCPGVPALDEFPIEVWRKISRH